MDNPQNISPEAAASLADPADADPQSFPAQPIYAGFWRRLVAAFIDTIILSLLITPLLIMIYGPATFESGQRILGVWHVVIGYGLPAVLTLWLWRRFLGTPGKLVMRLQLVDEQTGGPVSLRQGALRYFGYFLAILPFGLGFLWIVFDSKKRGWHDLFAGTVVVKKTTERLLVTTTARQADKLL